MKSYNHKTIEKKWQKFWDEKKVYKADNASSKKKYYILDMFPYPSGAGLHVGHPRGYIGSDVLARMKRMQGFNVLHPMGFDSFGLPAEQFAIKTGKHPSIVTKNAIKTYKGQLQQIGFSFDWSREVSTMDPDYYRWTQWIFLKLYNSWYDTDKDKARPIEDLIAILEKKGNESVHAVCDEETPIVTKDEWNGMSELQQQGLLMRYRLAYEGHSEVNWSPSMGTVLANDEVNPDGTAERDGSPVEKKMMRQWFMRITAYADRLLKDLDGLDWSQHIKDIQTNWIGKSEGSLLPFSLKIGEIARDIFVFTTRPDTLFGVTYVVLAPEHDLVQEYKDQILNWSEVESYIASVKKIDEFERTNANREKTGVELKGITAVNPANGETVPVWIADYVLAQYGTGIVMAVPAHDERDFAFAKKFDLPIKYSVAPYFVDETENSKKRENIEVINRVIAVAIMKHFNEEKYLMLDWKNGWTGFITGGLESNENEIDAAIREIQEETGYKNIKFIKKLGNPNVSLFYAPHKNKNQLVEGRGMYFELIDEEKEEISDEEKNKHEVVWKNKDEVLDFIKKGSEFGDGRYSEKFWSCFIDGEKAFSDSGILINSNQFNGLSSEEAKAKITEFVGGRLITKYKLRDAVFARQRYWGEPIPLIHTKDGLLDEVKEKDLPLQLPNVKSYAPTGNGDSPLASVASWMKAGYETNTMPGWAGSSWYFLRYMDPQNKKSFAGEKALKYWKDVDMYVGGAEHATGHLLYSRFWHKFLFDMKLVPTKEPFKALRNQGMILGADNRKMSKRWGNVVNPDDVVATYGADSLRLFEMFLGPFDSQLPWSTDGIIGCRRFLERVWRLQEKFVAKGKTSTDAERALHKCIKKVTDDIQTFGFNTAVSAMMICLNEMEKADQIATADYASFLQILAPFAPHMAEDLWQTVLCNKKSITVAGWPKWSASKIKESTVNLPVQINGKVRTTLAVAPDADQADVEALAREHTDVIKWLDGKEIKKVIYVPGRIINIVIG